MKRFAFALLLAAVPVLNAVVLERSIGDRLVNPVRIAFVVTNTADDGDGSLRKAILDANAGCTPACKIDFKIAGPPPAEGWFTIRPRSPLPEVTAQDILIDGAAQTDFTGDTNPGGPEIAIDGRSAGASASGLVLRPSGPAANPSVFAVKNLAVGNFDGPALLIFSGFRSEVANNYLGVDPAGRTAQPNLRGLMVFDSSFLTIHDNLISGNRYSAVFIWSSATPVVRENRMGVAADGTSPLPNGASGIFFGPGTASGAALDNRIWFNGDFGIAVARTASWIEAHGNSMKKNGNLGLDFGLDAPTPNVADDSTRSAPNAPLLTSARYDAAANQTVISGRIDAVLPPGCDCTLAVEVYRSSSIDAWGYAQGEVPLGAAAQFAGPAHSDFTIRIGGDLTGAYISATSNRLQILNFGAPGPGERPSAGNSRQATSEMSNPVRVE